MRERAWIQRFLLALVALFAVSLLTAPSASAVCIGGQEYVGVSPTGPIKVGDAAYPSGVAYTVPEWYGYGAPPITAWYNNSPSGIINPGSNLCSTTDFGGLFNQSIPEGISSLTAGLLNMDYALLDVSQFSGTWVSQTQAKIQSFINSGPYQNLYNVLVWLVVAIGIVTVFLLILTQDQRDRSDMMRTLMSGGSVRSRKSAAIKEVGWILLSIVTFGFIVAGMPYSIQKVVTDVSSGFSTAIQYELNNFSAGISGNKNSAITTDICAHSATNAFSGANGNSSIQCNLYRIYQWTPWLVMQFGSTNPAPYKIDPTNHFITDSDEAKMAIEQVRAKFGDEAATLAPYIQMQILRGNNNEGYSGVPEMTIEQRYQAFKDFGLAIDEAKVSQPWAQYWAGQGDAKAGRTFNSIVALLFVLLLVFPVVTLVLLGNAIAGIGAAILPIFGLFFALLIGVRQWRKKGMKILKWWIYCLLIPPIVSFSLALSLSMALLVTGLIDFSGLSLFLYLVLSSFVFVGVLLYLLFMLKKSAKRAAGTVDGTADDPGLIEKTLPAAAAVAGNMIAPGVGGAIGGAIGAGMVGGEEPRPPVMDDVDSGDEGRPQLTAGMGGAAAKALGGGEPRSGGGAGYFASDDDEIIDAEIVDEYTPEDSRIVQGRVLTGGEWGGGEEPRVLPPSAMRETRAIGGASPSGSGEASSSDDGAFSGDFGGDAARMQAIADEGVRRIVQATATGATIVDAVAQDRAAAIMQGAEEAVAATQQRVDEHAQSSADSVRVTASEHADTVRQAGQTERESVNAEGEGERRRLFRASSTAVEDVQAASAASGGEARAAAAEMAASVRDAEGVAHDIAESQQEIADEARVIDKAADDIRGNRRQ